MVGFHALDLSTLCCRIGAPGRLPGLLAGAICAVLLFVGSPLLAFVPNPILGGLLLFLGLDFLVQWVVDGWSKLPRADYAVVILILVVIAATDFLIGVGVGLLAMIVLFVLNYSRINVVHHALSGAEIKSNVERCAYHRRWLRQLGQHTYVLELRGFIFFGTANALLEKIRARVADVEQLPVRFIVLDFRRVTGLDSSAVLSFVKVKHLAQTQGITLVLTDISEEMQGQFERGDLSEGDEGIHLFPDLDFGLEWCEDQLLRMEQVTMLNMPTTLYAQLVDSGFEKDRIPRLMEFLEKTRVKEGEYLIRQGSEAEDLYFIEMGAASIYLELQDGKRLRLQTLGPGTVVGELGLYLGTTRTASVIADMPTTAYRLTQAALSEMQKKEPELAAAFHELVARALSERLVATTRSLEAVLK
jgi:SulP family sulfate permease